MTLTEITIGLSSIVMLVLASSKRFAGDRKRFGGVREWLIARARPTPSAAVVIGRVWLTPNHSIHVVDIGGRSVTIGCYAGGMTLLGDRNAGNEK